MTEEIEVDPPRGASVLGAAEGGSIKSASGVEVIDREGNMKGGQAHGVSWHPSYDVRKYR
jgi:hypothetical protein